MKKLMTAVVVLLVMMGFVTDTYAQKKDPKGVFGYVWGTPVALLKVRKELTSERLDDISMLFQTGKPPKGIPGFDNYALLASKKHGLVKVVAVGKDITGDPYGTEGKAAYEKLSASLAKKYEKTNEGKSVGAKLYQEADEFYECLKYPGCGIWGVVYTGKDHTVMLTLSGTGRGRGYLKLTVEAIPGMDNYILEQEAWKNKGVDDAL